MDSSVGDYHIRFRLALVSVVYLLNATAGTWLAISRDLSGRPLGMRTGLPVGSDFVFGFGTALSAPLVLLLTLIGLNWWMVRRPNLRAAKGIGILGVGFLVGMVVEPILGEALAGSHDSLVTSVIVGNLVVPIAMVAIAIVALGLHGRRQ